MIYKILAFIGLLAMTTHLVNGLTATQARANPLLAYVLQDQAGQVIGNSGVRVGPIDLGLTSQRLLQNYDLPQPLIKKFLPYIGLTGTQAFDALKANPLRVSQEELNTIEQKFKAYWIPRFNTAPVTIRQSPQAQQIYSLAQKNDWVPFLQQIDKFIG